MKRTRLPRLGDIMYVMDLESGAAYGHFIANGRFGPLITFYECDTDWAVGRGLQSCRYKFGPVFCGVNPPVRSGNWRIIGSSPVPDSPVRQAFLAMTYGKPPHRPVWWYYDGVQERQIGTEVPESMKCLELWSIWPAELIEERLKKGNNPHSYRSIMLSLGFDP